MVKVLTYGRMGNFLFQVATCIGYCMEHNLEFTIPDTTTHDFHNPLYLQHLVNPKWNPNLPHAVLTQPHFHYTPIPFSDTWRDINLILNGYWQSWKYFDKYREDVIRLFGYKWKMTKAVAVHVRRGDYLVLTQKHPPVPVEWIIQAMNMFKGYYFIFFSDDIAWCQKTFGMRDDCGFSLGRTIEEDLIYMSCCEHQICSASTYSWWGAYLNQNPNKKIVLPQKWFQDGWDNADTKDIIPPDWTKL